MSSLFSVIRNDPNVLWVHMWMGASLILHRELGELRGIAVGFSLESKIGKTFTSEIRRSRMGIRLEYGTL